MWKCRQTPCLASSNIVSDRISLWRSARSFIPSRIFSKTIPRSILNRRMSKTEILFLVTTKPNRKKSLKKKICIMMILLFANKLWNFEICFLRFITNNVSYLKLYHVVHRIVELPDCLAAIVNDWTSFLCNRNGQTGAKWDNLYFFIWTLKLQNISSRQQQAERLALRIAMLITLKRTFSSFNIVSVKSER